MQEPGRITTPDIDLPEDTLQLTGIVTEENTLVFKYGPTLQDELERLNHSKRTFEVVIVDATQAGFLFPAEEMICAADIVCNVLEVQGALVFVKQDQAVAFVKETASGSLSFHLFSTFSSIYDYSSTIAQYIQQAMGQTIDIRRESTDLSEQILLTVIPILNSFGIKLKASVEGSCRRNLVLSAIDNYTPLNTISQRLTQHMNFDELMDELKQLEKAGAIYPFFAKIPFLVKQFRAGKQFKLKDYLLEAKLLTQEQLDDVIFAAQNNKGGQRLSLGAMCVAKGLISSRQLEIALQDQYFFGQMRESEKTKVRIESDEHMQSLIGNLRTTDPAGVLQNLSSNRSNGVLVVEHKDLTFRAVFEQGKLTFARQHKLKGSEAVLEFVSVWKEGIYVFLERSTPPDLSQDECKVTRPLDKLIMDSALASDNIEAVWKQFGSRTASVLEKLADHAGVLSGESLTDPQEGYELSGEEIENMQRVWNLSDGLSTISDIIKNVGDMTTVKSSRAISRLLYYELLRAPEIDLSKPLSNFRTMISLITAKIGVDQSGALLRIALRESLGYSSIARVFSLGLSCEVGVDLSAAKAASLSLTQVVKALEDWQVKYIEHVSQELDRSVLRQMVLSVYNK